MTETKTIDPIRVEEILKDCLYREDELPEPNTPPEGCVRVRGVVHNYGFHPERLESHRDEIRGFLDLLPATFHVGRGDGWSFLNACVDKDGNQWTSQQTSVEALFCLAIGLGMAEWKLPREMWAMLPGGVPYVSVNTAQSCERATNV